MRGHISLLKMVVLGLACTALLSPIGASAKIDPCAGQKTAMKSANTKQKTVNSILKKATSVVTRTAKSVQNNVNKCAKQENTLNNKKTNYEAQGANLQSRIQSADLITGLISLSDSCGWTSFFASYGVRSLVARLCSVNRKIEGVDTSLYNLHVICATTNTRLSNTAAKAVTDEGNAQKAYDDAVKAYDAAAAAYATCQTPPITTP